MGQQQLLLVILVTIIVGIATVVAINTFGAAADSANLDAVRQDVAQIAAAAQGYYMKPAMLGGGSRSFVGITFNDIAFAASEISGNARIAVNENGRYILPDVQGDPADPSVGQSFVITAHPASDPSYSPGVDGSAATNIGTATIRANDADAVTFAEDPDANN